MSDENIKETIENEANANTEVTNAVETSTANILATPEAATNNAVSQDLSKIKIRTILKERLKKGNLKKTISIILICLICFAAGIGVDRLVMNHKDGKNFKGRPGFNQNFQNNRNVGKQFKGMKDKTPPNNVTPKKE